MEKNTERLSIEALEEKNLLFRPKTPDEVNQIYQDLMIHLDCEPSTMHLYGDSFHMNITDAIDNGILVKNYIIYDVPEDLDLETVEDLFECTPEQIYPEPGTLNPKEPGADLIRYEGDAEAAQEAREDSYADTKGLGLTDEAALQEALAGIDAMVGLTEAKTEINESLSFARLQVAKKEMGLSTESPCMHMVFTGNPGTGKTTFAREVAKIFHALGLLATDKVVEVTRDDLIGDVIGGTEKKTKAAIKNALGGVLFIDEAYALTGSGEGKDFGKQAVDTLIAAMENHRENLIVIAAGYPAPMKGFLKANPGLKSRFPTVIDFANYSPEELGQIMDGMLEKAGATMDDEARAMALEMLDAEKNKSKDTFGNGRTVRTLVEKVQKVQAARLDAEGILGPNRGDLNDEDFKTALTQITPADLAGVSLADVKGADTGMSFGRPRQVHAPAQTAAASTLRH